MEENYVRLAVSWYDRPPMPKALNVYRIIGGVSFDDGKAVFKLEQNGNVVRIDTDQLFRITAVELKK